MNVLLYILRFIYNIRFWLLIFPALIALLVFYLTRNPELEYQSETTVYTGVFSGKNFIMSDADAVAASVQNAKMENMITIVTSAKTLQNVSIKLFALCMIKGDPKKDNEFIKAKNFIELDAITPKEVKDLIDKSSVDKSAKKLNDYYKKDMHNFLYGLFNWNHKYFSYLALTNISVKRMGSGDILKISYSCDDPGITYNTLNLLIQEFVKQYNDLSFAGTNDVIEFFRQELKRVENELNQSEDSLTEYNIKNKVINYGEQTKQVAAINRDYTLEYEDNRFKYESTKSLVENLEKRIGDNAKILKTNSEFLHRLKNISELTSFIMQAKITQADSVRTSTKINDYTQKLNKEEQDFKTFAEDYYKQKYSKEGYPNEEIISQWLNELLRLQGYAAQKVVLDDWKKDLDSKYSYYSPIGATLKRMERGINFTEASYLAVLKGLHDAILRQKSMEMTSANIKVVASPIYPLAAKPTKRKMLIMVAYIASIIFLIFFFIIIDFLDQTLRDRLRTERITGGKVISAFPRLSPKKYQEYNEKRREIAARHLLNSLVLYYAESKPVIINLLSISAKDGKSFLGKYLQNIIQKEGLKVRYINWEEDFVSKTRAVILSKSICDIVEYTDEDIFLVEYGNLQEYSISNHLLDEANVNLLITQVSRIWKETDKRILDSLSKHKTPLFIELNNARFSVVEEFTGMLPPYPKIRKIGYRILNLGLTPKNI